VPLTDPTTENEDQAFFDAKEKCIDTVLERTLPTDQGKVFGLQHERISMRSTLTHP
jgi:hypothetical protein